MGCRLWGRTESDTTEATQQQQQQQQRLQESNTKVSVSFDTAVDAHYLSTSSLLASPQPN